MDFFEAQDRARRRSGRLVLLFALALLGTIAALYGVAILLARFGIGRPLVGWQPDLLGGVAVFTVLVCGIASLYKWQQLRAGGPAVAEMVGGRPVEPDTSDLRERTLLNVVEEMALASGLPVPAVYVLPGEAGINAFAAGYSPADAAVAVTEGALHRLDRDELQGVVAHEFSHILNGDMRLNTRLTSLVFGILALSILGRVVLRGIGIGNDVSTLSRRRSRGDRDSAKGIVLVAAAGLALLVIGYLGHLFGRLVQAAVSRQREFLADASAVQFTRNPAGIGGALKKLGGSALGGRMGVATAGEISHFCFAQNFRSAFGGLLATHPPLARRLRAIDPSFDGVFPPLPPAPLPRPEHVPYPAAHQVAPSLFSAAPAHLAPSAARAPGAGASHPMHPARAAVLSALGAPPRPGTLDAAGLIGAAGEFSTATVQAGRAFLANLPDTLRHAAHAPGHAPALCLALCLPPHTDGPGTPPAAWLELVARHASAATARQVGELHPLVAELPRAHHLPLLQLAAPALRQLDPGAAATLIDTLHALVHADGILTPHEFALQKIVARTLGLASKPRDAIHVLAPADVVGELSLALSAAARIDAADERAAAMAFARAATEFNGLQPPLAYHPAGPATLDDLDLALEHLAHTPAPFRRRVLLAFATALTADQRLTQSEADMLRAFAAALDCPLPPALPVSP